MNEIQMWDKFNKEEISCCKNFTDFMDIIKTFDNSDQNKWVKWKNYSNQIVFETPNYFFKIYQSHLSNQFYPEIRNELGKIYRNKYNILWDIVTVHTKEYIYQIECRQKLRLITQRDMSLKEIIQSWSRNTLPMLESGMKLNKMTKLINLIDQYSDVKQMKLIRDCINKYIDYGMTDNGDVILLDDMDWFMAMIDQNGKWLSKKYRMIPCDLTGEDLRYLIPYNFQTAEDFLYHTNEKENKWNIINTKYLAQLIDLDFISEREEHIKQNIDIIVNCNFLGYDNAQK